MSAEILKNMDFRDVAFWYRKDGFLRYQYDGAKEFEGIFDISNVLYAFVEGHEVRYIGKTTQSARTRFIGYCTPSPAQSTNVKCNREIGEIVDRGGTVRIFIFSPISHFSYAEFPINLAAGLEDALVARLQPRWNGKGAGKNVIVRTETAEQEQEALHIEEEPLAIPTEYISEFTIKLGTTYYRDGMVNPGVDASKHLGPRGDPITISFSDGTSDVTSAINRTANKTGAVRFVGNNSLIADWFRMNFRKGEYVRVLILSPNRVMFLAQQHSKSSNV
ncbi:hypothetical protein [Asticcacaulis solisilvae]|uniref:hypothetical protein n=1 Tax=Asticcacaulis solisilvae TaxID=1217274 RepID=UPI003FD87127